MNPCEKCSKPASFRCSRCYASHYCSPECLRGDWPTHKAVCASRQQQILAYTDELLGCQDFVLLAFGLLGRFEVMGRTEGAYCGYVQCVVQKMAPRKFVCAQTGERVGSAQFYNGTIMFIQGPNENMRAGHNLVELMYEINNQWHVKCIHASTKQCADARDSIVRLGYKPFTVKAGDRVEFACEVNTNDFQTNFPGLKLGK